MDVEHYWTSASQVYRVRVWSRNDVAITQGGYSPIIDTGYGFVVYNLTQQCVCVCVCVSPSLSLTCLRKMAESG